MTSERKLIGRWKAIAWPLVAAAALVLPALGLFASSSADVSLTIRPVMRVTPASVNDLALTATAQEGQLRLDWTAPTVFPGTVLDSYQIRVQTFSLANVGGSTTTWWNTSGGIFVQGLYGESPGQAVTRTLGPSGSSHTASLYPGATYYAAVRSADDIGTPLDYWADITQTLIGIPLDSAPGVPSGLAATVGVSTITLSWTDLSSVQKGIDFDRYQIYRSVVSGSGFVLIATSTSTSYTDASVSVGTPYYYRITALDRGAPSYPGTALESAPSAQVTATIVFATSNGPPLRPNGLTLSAAGGQFTFQWHPVTFDTNNQAVSIDHYLVYRYDTIGSTPTVTDSVPASQTSYTDTVGGLIYFYRVFAVGANGNISAASDYVDSSSSLNRYILASDDATTRVVVPGSLMTELNHEYNGYGEDLEISIVRRQTDEVDVTLRSYRVRVNKARTGEDVPSFAFSQMGMQVQLGLGAVLGTGHLNVPPGQLGTTAGSIAQIVSVYWYNGASYLRLSDPVLTSAQAISVNVKNVGIYQVRATQISTVFRLSQNSPYPRVITPNDPAQNNRVFWFFDNPAGDSVTGTIYDIRGAKVRDLVVNGQSPTSNSLVWDGHDSNGAVVPSGVYLYKIAAGKEKVTGTVVVAR